MLIRMAGPSPVEALHTALELDNLWFGERFAIWTMRMWFATLSPDGSHRPLLDKAYRTVGATEAMPSIDGALWVFKVGARRPVDISAPCKRALTCDEKRVLHLLACHQQGIAIAAQPVAEALFPPSAARASHRPLSLWADILERVGLDLPMRDWDLPELRRPEGVRRNSLH
jgi:hypothetical protein